MSFLRMAPRRIWSFLNIVNSVVPKNERKIFLYSNMGFRDNIRAVYDYLIENGYNSRFKIICSLDDRAVVKREKNVKLINNLRGLFSFFTCKYVFYCFGKYPVKPKRGQKVFNLWHGMPLKRIGNMLPGYEKTDYNYFTGILCTSEFFRDIMKKSFSCDDGQIIILSLIHILPASIPSIIPAGSKNIINVIVITQFMTDNTSPHILFFNNPIAPISLNIP